MTTYEISCKNPSSQFVQLAIKIQIQFESEISLQLPSWRPGRYQFADYAQNIRSLTITGPHQTKVPFKKKTKDCWVFKAYDSGEYLVEYEYYAAKMDAGSAWVDNQQVYLNFVNCCFEVKGIPPSEIFVHLLLPKFPKAICTLKRIETSIYSAENFQHLADATLIAAKKLTHWDFTSQGVLFHIWIHGSIYFDKKLFLRQFQEFTERQITDFTEFPEQEYHFMLQLLPYPHYHGVEHKQGTVITFGPSENLSEASQMEELLGVASHELYHAWNVCRIRPKEFFPYDFSNETYTEAGWILEGITTYMGDLYLLKSKVYSLETYFKHLEKIINREAISFGWRNQSILESSFDLWLDGYQPGIPDKKVSIYSRGALICFCLDIMLLKSGSSLAKVMKLAWTKFGRPNRSYSVKAFWNAILRQSSQPDEFSDFYSCYIDGKQDLIRFLGKKVKSLGLELTPHTHPDILRSKLGILSLDGLVSRIHPESPAYDKLMIGDKIEPEFFEKRTVLKITSVNGATSEVTFPLQDSEYFPLYTMTVSSPSDLREKWME